MKALKFFVFLFLSCVYLNGTGQTSSEEFGQNRVQYKGFDWSYYTASDYKVYYYLGGQEIGKFTVVITADILKDMEQQLQYSMDEDIEILVFNNLSDLEQTNIRSDADQSNTGGTTRIIGNKLFIYFDGNHQHLEQQIREGIAEVFINNMMFGGNVQEVLQNAVLLNLPPWFTNGLSSYEGQSWSSEMDNKLRDGILTGRYKKFNRLYGADATFAGHSIWHYIELNYGSNAIPNLLYLTRINRSLESGFTFVLGRSVNQTISDWYNYYLKLYTNELVGKLTPNTDELISENKKTFLNYNQLHINTTADKIAFVTNEMGRYKVRMMTLKNRNHKTLFRGGFKQNVLPVDHSYPVLAWDPSGKRLAIIYTRRNKTFLITYDTEKKKKEKRLIASFQKISSVSFGSDINTLYISAINRGQSDIYTFNIKSSKMEQITNDFWDDLNPVFVTLPKRQGILFASNRINDTLRNQSMDTILPDTNYDIWFYNSKTKSRELLQVTHTPQICESNPMAFNDQLFCYLSDANGINNRYTGYIDSVFSHFDHYFYFADSTVINPAYNIDSLMLAQHRNYDSTTQIPVYRDTAYCSAHTNYAYGILEQDVAMKANQMVEMVLFNGHYQFYLSPIPKNLETQNSPVLQNTSYGLSQLNKLIFNYQKPPVTLPTTLTNLNNESDTGHVKPDTLKAETNHVDINNYFFQSDFSDQTYVPKKDTTNKPNNTSSILPEQILPTHQTIFKLSKVLPYTVKFSTDYLVTQFDNSLIINRYQNVAGNGGNFNNPNLGAFIKAGISDLMEDYKIVGGFSLPTSLGGAQYFMTFENLKQRLDKKCTFYRGSELRTYDANPYWYLPVDAHARTNYFETSLRYPIDFTKSIRLNIGYRAERIIFLSTDSFSLNLDPYKENWVNARGEFVFDNTIKVQTNIWTGSRGKIFFDFQKQVDAKNINMFVLGCDIRHYEKIDRQIIWATRFAGSTSFGDARVAYILGGVDNWLNVKSNTNNPVPLNSNYAFQTLSTNVRGFVQNARNGNNYALINTEIRIPVFSYLFNTPIRSEIIRNFQFIAFADAGAAWEGLSPYSENNPFNSNTIIQGPVTVHVNYYREPLIVGYGAGLRTSIFGYFVRFDLGYGIENGVVQAPLKYFSFTTDF